MNKDLLRHQRFYLALKDFGIQDRQLAKKMGKRYVAISPFKTALMPGTIDVLDYLHSKYPMHIITNGFEEVQYLKMSNTGIDKYFKKIITSEKVGRRKPEPKIFHFALKKAKCDAQHAIMIGDDLNTDVNGAIDAGLHAIWFNHHQKEHGPLKHPVIHHLSQLRDLL
jgi:putative hydrolase of the HAD superfamily